MAMGPISSPVMCTIDMKDTAKNLLRAVAIISRTSHHCKHNDEDSRPCAANALRIMSAFAGMGEYMAGAIGHCRRTFTPLAALAVTKAETRMELCAEAAAALLQHTSAVAAASVTISKKCFTDHPTVHLEGFTHPQTVVVEQQVPRLFAQDDDGE